MRMARVRSSSRLAGHLVRLAVEQDLEPVLDLAEEAVGVVHDASLVGGQAADLLELGDGRERVGAADLGVLAAVEQLEELDDELDVADPAVAGLDLELGACRPRPCAARSAASGP